jgi:ABC-type multidrug transport system fused ATPase/permease subunit
MNRYRFDARGQLFSHLLRLSVPFYQDRRSTTVIEQGGKGVEAGTQLLRRSLNGQLITDIPVGIFALGYVAHHNLLAALVLVGFTVCFVCLSRSVGRRCMATQEEREAIDNELRAWQREVLALMTTVKLNRAESRELAEVTTRGEEILKLENRQDLLDSTLESLGQIAHALPFGLALFLFLPQVANGTMTVGTLFALVMYASRAVGPMGYLGAIYQEILVDVARLKPALKLLSEQPSIIEAPQPVAMLPLRHELALKDVGFAYPGAERPMFQRLSLTIPAGKKTAIVGRTGSGKSTLVRLLARFYDPQHGVITVDGTDLRQISFDSLYREVCYVTQEVPIFTGTIAQNIGYGASEYDKRRLDEACRLASADFIFRLPHGLYTSIGELGGKLSGGERQRLALARIFLRQPSIIILDEATAALDQLTEREISAAFDQLLQMNRHTTIVVIAHRMSTIQHADRIVVLDHGAVLDIGGHEEVLGRCPLYRGLCQELVQ